MNTMERFALDVFLRTDLSSYAKRLSRDYEVFAKEHDLSVVPPYGSLIDYVMEHTVPSWASVYFVAVKDNVSVTRATRTERYAYMAWFSMAMLRDDWEALPGNLQWQSSQFGPLSSE
jgi:hypothetical protein